MMNQFDGIVRRYAFAIRGLMPAPIQVPRRRKLLPIPTPPRFPGKARWAPKLHGQRAPAKKEPGRLPAKVDESLVNITRCLRESAPKEMVLSCSRGQRIGASEPFDVVRASEGQTRDVRGRTGDLKKLSAMPGKRGIKTRDSRKARKSAARSGKCRRPP